MITNVIINGYILYLKGCLMDMKELNKLSKKATKHSSADFYRLGGAILFMVAILLYTFLQNGGVPQVTFLAVAAVVGGYMAMNIGANDVANNVGPAVGSKALTLTGAIIIAVIFEASGALIAGGDVVSTIKKGIIDPAMFPDANVFIWAMLAALFGGAIWLNLATAIGAPVSTTHSIVGGVMGAGIAASGFDIVNWEKMGAIASSWVISPVLGGVIAALFLYTIRISILHKDNMLEASRKVIPILISLMAFAFATYIAMKGIKKIVKLDIITALSIGAVIGAIVFATVKPMILKMSQKLANTRRDINKMFTIPLIFAAALLSFAHGANDVANAIGPLAAINDAIMSGAIAHKAQIPLWVMMVGAIGIAIGLAMYGPKLIRTVGSEITELDQSRAWSVAMASAIVVIFASWLGLPVSSTHIAIGGIFGVGFLRIYMNKQYEDKLQGIRESHILALKEKIDSLEKNLAKSSETLDREKLKLEIEEKREDLHNVEEGHFSLTQKERKDLKKLQKKKYVKREMLFKIIAAWLITVPVAGFLSAILYFTIRGIML